MWGVVGRAPRPTARPMGGRPSRIPMVAMAFRCATLATLPTSTSSSASGTVAVDTGCMGAGYSGRGRSVCPLGGEFSKRPGSGRHGSCSGVGEGTRPLMGTVHAGGVCCCRGGAATGAASASGPTALSRANGLLPPRPLAAPPPPLPAPPPPPLPSDAYGAKAEARGAPLISASMAAPSAGSIGALLEPPPQHLPACLSRIFACAASAPVGWLSSSALLAGAADGSAAAAVAAPGSLSSGSVLGSGGSGEELTSAVVVASVSVAAAAAAVAAAPSCASTSSLGGGDARAARWRDATSSLACD